MIFQKRVAAFRYAINGVVDAIATQIHMKLHIIAAVVVILAAWFFQIKRWEWAVVLLTIGIVWAAEIMNTAIEYVVNLVSPDYHILAGKAKDAAAGAVLVISMSALCIGFIIFGKRVIDYFWTIFIY